MENSTRPRVSRHAPVREVIQEITEKRLGATVVMDDDGKICGIVTDGDIRRMLEKHDNIGQLTADDILSANPIQLSTDTLATKAMQILQKNKISQIVVIDEDGYYQGIVHFHDLTKEGIVE